MKFKPGILVRNKELKDWYLLILGEDPLNKNQYSAIVIDENMSTIATSKRWVEFNYEEVNICEEIE